MEPVDATDAAIREAAVLLNKGELVAFPTETVYGLGADALNAYAVAKIFEVKQRPSFDPLIVHVPSLAEALDLMAAEDPRVAVLAEAFWPGPLTVVVPKHSRVPDIVTAGLPTVALRIPDHTVAQKLLRYAGCPVAAPSANPFSYVSPTSARHVQEQLGAQVACILDGGACRVGIESTVVSLVGPQAEILRPGIIEPSRLESLLGPVLIRTGSAKPQAPGQLSRHYATRTPLELVDGAGEVKIAEGEKVGLLCLRSPAEPERFAAVVTLSPEGDLAEAAAGLFAGLRRLDSLQLDRVAAECVPEKGIGLAIMDRLKRSAHKSSIS